MLAESELPSEADDVAHPHCDALIIGAGFSGLAALYELREKLGLSVRLLEAGTDVGGVWHWNRYPGARCDSDSFVYCYSFSKELQNDWEWSERYAAQPEIQRYLQYVADRFEMRRDIEFGTRVTSAVYRETSNEWVVSTEDGQTFRCTYLISAVGPLSRVFKPPFEGMDTFEGDLHLASQWPEGPVDLAGKRVALVGTGATGIQMTPRIASVAAQLTVFQRTPQYVLPARNFLLDAGKQLEIKSTYDEIWAQTRRQAFALPIDDTKRLFSDVNSANRQRLMERAWELGGFRLIFEAFADVMTDEECNQAVADFVRNKIRAIVADPETAERLAPKNKLTRPQLGHHYYETYNRANVSLVDIKADPIESITPKGIRTASGEYEFDVIVFALGFDGGTGAMTQMGICGRDGQSLEEKWEAGPRTYLGICVDEFPNMFMVFGPQTCFANAPVISERASSWIAKAISHMREQGHRAMEPTPEAVESWVDHVAEVYYGTAYKHGKDAGSWLVGANVPGKPIAPQLYVGSAASYFDRIEQEVDDEFKGFTFDGQARVSR